MAVLWLSSVARPAHPSSGGHEVFPTRLAIPLHDVRACLEASRARVERHREPPLIPLAAGRPMEGAHLRHRNYLLWVELVAEIEGAIERGEDLACDEFAPLARGWCGSLVGRREFAEALCPACERSYPADECATAPWSSVAGPRCGVGGVRLTCPAGHTLFIHQTWVA